MPPIGMLLRGVDFANIFWVLKRGKKTTITRSKYKSLPQAKEDGAVTINFGVFLNSLINFLVLSIIIFTMVRAINTLKRKKQIKSAKECRYCFSKIDIRAVKCAYCGSIQEEEEQQPSISPKSDLSPRSSILLVDSDDEDDDTVPNNKNPGYKYWKKNLKKQISRSLHE